MVLQEFENAFANWAEKRENLTIRAQQLGVHVNEEDLSILNQRLRLLHKQWEEILNQVELRKQRIEGKLNKWQLFSDRHREMMEWISQMEAKISSNTEYDIEDLISKLLNVSFCVF